MSWDEVSKKLEEMDNASGLFVRLEGDGDRVVGAFRGEATVRETVYTGGKVEEYDPAVHAEKDKRVRFQLNFFNLDEEKMQIIEGGKKWIEQVLYLKDKFGFDKCFYEIRRSGKKGDPKTTYSIVPDKEIGPAILEEINKLQLNELGGNKKSQSDEALGAQA